MRIGCKENNDLPRNPKRARTCFACETKKYSWWWGQDLYNVETLSCKFWSIWTEIKTAALAQLGILLCVRRDLQLDCVLLQRLQIDPDKRLTVRLCFAAKITNRAYEWEETYSQPLFFQKDYQTSLWVSGDLQSDFTFVLFVTKVTNWACKWEENYGWTFCQKDYQLSLWVRRDLWLDLFYFLFIIQLANTWFKENKWIKISAS